MKIFFSTTTHQIEIHGDRYYKIRDHLIDTGAVLVHDWLAGIKKVKGKYVIPPKISKDEYSKAIESIEKADLLIFESTIPSFSTGHLMTLGLQKKIPTLVMWHESSPLSNRKGLIESIESNYLEVSEYNMDNYREVLNKFINKYGDSDVRHRFNLVIDEAERQYLDWLSYNTFDSRTSIIRFLIREQMEKDEDYDKYLSKMNLG